MNRNYLRRIMTLKETTIRWQKKEYIKIDYIIQVIV